MRKVREPDLRFGIVLMNKQEVHMKGIIAWFLGVPVVVIILLYVVGIF